MEPRGRRPGPECGSEDRALPDAVELGVLWSELQLLVLSMTASARGARPPDGVRLLGRTLTGIWEGLDWLETRAGREVVSTQRFGVFDPRGTMERRNRASARRGVRLATVVSPHVHVGNPFFATEVPYARTGPVFGPCIVVDRACAVLPGAPTAHGDDVAWLFTRADVVERTKAIWRLTFESSRVSDEQVRRFTPRQLEVARRRSQGWTCARIARDLGVSARTVTSDLNGLPTPVHAG